ncbi:recombinase family protein [Fredinandcohnia sp. 179-A 10B2 NHS]|uniref:recombinase family protein n=1 Tax=Fredinandcohnia sp. 179-A 10B2 NHS TaxID=3235176 RepID=UPI00399FFCC5
MKTAIYIRVSTEEQAKEGYSISAQRERLKAYCIAQDWTVANFYVDEGISAKDMKRPQLQQMVKDIKTGKIDCVLVYRLDRLTRSVLDLYKLLEVFEKHDCKFKSATEVYDTTTAMGRMFITIVAALAQWERENMGERISMGFSEKVRQGRYAHNNRPFGYNLEPTSGELTIREDEAAVVRLIVNLYIKQGMGANKICKYLNSRNIKTRDGNSWNDKPLVQLLKNPLYKGTIRWTDQLVEGAAPAIIDEDTWDEIQRTLERRRTLPPQVVSSDYIFSSVYKCKLCGYTMTGYKVTYTKTNGEKVEYKNYRCLHKKTGQCKGSMSTTEKSLEEAFLEYLDNIDFSKAIEEVAAIKSNRVKPSNDEETIKFLKSELQKIEKRKKKWQYAWANETINDEDFSKRMEEEKLLEDNIKEQFSQFSPQDEIKTDPSDVYRILQNVRNNWNHLTDGEKKTLVQMTIKEIHVKHEKKNETIVEHIDFL